ATRARATLHYVQMQNARLWVRTRRRESTRVAAFREARRPLGTAASIRLRTLPASQRGTTPTRAGTPRHTSRALDLWLMRNDCSSARASRDSAGADSPRR